MFFCLCVCHLEISGVPYVWILFMENEVPITCSLSLSLVFMYISHAIYTWIEEEKSLSPTFISFENVQFHSSKT